MATGAPPDVPTNVPPERRALAARARDLLEAHHAARPLLLANAWDVASARAVEEAGLGFVATSSRAVAAVLGEPDDDSSDPDLVFSFLSRIVRAVSVPVTADLQAGLRLRPAELVERLAEAGAVGCNLEDSDHHGAGDLVPAEQQAAYLAEVRSAADESGTHVVVNARTDAFVRLPRDAPRLEEAVRRGSLYFEAGADCVYPMLVERKEDVVALVASLPGPLNFLARRGGLSLAELAGLGASRISLASGLFHLLHDRLVEILGTLGRGGDGAAGFDLVSAPGQE
ncbi:MAG: isocitrate lyase/PEP mutase family protein [Acidimicrobiales bacterium]